MKKGYDKKAKLPLKKGKKMVKKGYKKPVKGNELNADGSVERD